jgi:hypothetical protein
LPAVAVGGVVAVALMAGPAFAHECFVANRSAQGDAAVGAHSKAWSAVSLDTILVEFVGLPQPLADCIEANAADFGLRQTYVFGDKQAVGQDGVIAEHNPNMATGKNADGKGIDHGEDAIGPLVMAAAEFCSSP